MDQHSAHDQKSKNRADFNQHHDVIGFGRLAHSSHQEQRQNKNNQKPGQIEIRARPSAGSPDRSRPFIGKVNSEDCQLRFRIAAEAHGHGDVADHVFKNQVPANDPGENFSEGGVGVGISAARDGDHRSQFGIAKSGEAARDRH